MSEQSLKKMLVFQSEIEEVQDRPPMATITEEEEPKSLREIIMALTEDYERNGERRIAQKIRGSLAGDSVAFLRRKRISLDTPVEDIVFERDTDGDEPVMKAVVSLRKQREGGLSEYIK